MRLDLFLKLSRLIPRRTVAQEFCDNGLVEVNGITAKSGRDVKTGDEIRIRRRGSVTTVRVSATPARKQVSKTEAAAIYELISTETMSSPEPF